MASLAETQMKPVIIMSCVTVSLALLQENVQEICIWESFSSSCSQGEVVLVESASFGRNEDSRCYNQTEPNGTARSIDVRDPIYKEFGTKQTLKFSLVHELFTKVERPWGKDLQPSLKISHHCSKVIENEICVGETFRATCPDGKIISIQSALFGRRYSSRCLGFDTSELGCYATVQPFVESQCNGRAGCNIPLPSHDFNQIQNQCDHKLKKYLEVQYTCSHGFSCPHVTASKDMVLDRLSDGYNVTCGKDNSVKRLRCAGGKWNEDPKSICHGALGPAFLVQILAFALPASLLFISIIAVVILVRRIQTKGTHGNGSKHRREEVENTYEGYYYKDPRSQSSTGERYEYECDDIPADYKGYCEMRVIGA